MTTGSRAVQVLSYLLLALLPHCSGSGGGGGGCSDWSRECQNFGSYVECYTVCRGGGGGGAALTLGAWEMDTTLTEADCSVSSFGRIPAPIAPSPSRVTIQHRDDGPPEYFLYAQDDQGCSYWGTKGTQRFQLTHFDSPWDECHLNLGDGCVVKIWPKEIEAKPNADGTSFTGEATMITYELPPPCAPSGKAACSWRYSLRGRFLPDVCVDLDSDGYGSPGNVNCAAGEETDCNDQKASIHPGAPEKCNYTVDDDCDGLLDPIDDVCE